jgi:hypothetical protein
VVGLQAHARQVGNLQIDFVFRGAFPLVLNKSTLVGRDSFQKLGVQRLAFHPGSNSIRDVDIGQGECKVMLAMGLEVPSLVVQKEIEISLIGVPLIGVPLQFKLWAVTNIIHRFFKGLNGFCLVQTKLCLANQ